jgi:hypothetical protein
MKNISGFIDMKSVDLLEKIKELPDSFAICRIEYVLEGAAKFSKISQKKRFLQKYKPVTRAEAIPLARTCDLYYGLTPESGRLYTPTLDRAKEFYDDLARRAKALEVAANSADSVLVNVDVLARIVNNINYAHEMKSVLDHDVTKEEMKAFCDLFQSEN